MLSKLYSPLNSHCIRIISLWHYRNCFLVFSFTSRNWERISRYYVLAKITFYHIYISNVYYQKNPKCVLIDKYTFFHKAYTKEAINYTWGKCNFPYSLSVVYIGVWPGFESQLSTTSTLVTLNKYMFLCVCFFIFKMGLIIPSS